MESRGAGQGLIAGSWNAVNKPSGPIKREAFLGQITIYQFKDRKSNVILSYPFATHVMLHNLITTFCQVYKS
jgi:hypothetical protein